MLPSTQGRRRRSPSELARWNHDWSASCKVVLPSTQGRRRRSPPELARWDHDWSASCKIVLPSTQGRRRRSPPELARWNHDWSASCKIVLPLAQDQRRARNNRSLKVAANCSRRPVRPDGSQFELDSYGIIAQQPFACPEISVSDRRCCVKAKKLMLSCLADQSSLHLASDGGGVRLPDFEW